MKALAYHGIKDVRVDRIDEPTLIAPRDAIVQVTLTTICGSDLHLYNGYIPTVEKGDVLGHEFVGRVVALGSDVDTLRIGDRVVVPFSIACGRCWYCRRGETSFCDNSNPNAWMAEKFYGYSPAGLFGYSHLLGGYAGGQAEYVRVPYADFGPMKIPDSVTDEQAIFLADIFPTGYMAADNAEIEPGDVVAVWGCGPVGQFAMKSAYLLGAERVIGIDRIEARLEMARTQVGAETINFEKVDVIHALHEMTGGRGPDACIDCVGLESHAHTIDAISDKLKEKGKLVTDRPHALRQAIQTCGKGGVVSIPGVYGGFVDTFPLGALFGKGLKIRTGQTHVQKYLPKLMGLIESRQIDPTFVVTHRGTLAEAPKFYDTFVKKDDGMMKVLLTP